MLWGGHDGVAYVSQKDPVRMMFVMCVVWLQGCEKCHDDVTSMFKSCGVLVVQLVVGVTLAAEFWMQEARK